MPAYKVELRIEDAGGFDPPIRVLVECDFDPSDDPQRSLDTLRQALAEQKLQLDGRHPTTRWRYDIDITSELV